jgi:hypothetical protein
MEEGPFSEPAVFFSASWSFEVLHPVELLLIFMVGVLVLWCSYSICSYAA